MEGTFGASPSPYLEFHPLRRVRPTRTFRRHGYLQRVAAAGQLLAEREAAADRDAADSGVIDRGPDRRRRAAEEDTAVAQQRRRRGEAVGGPLATIVDLARVRDLGAGAED